jgi:multicomponent Na+:H+ antiporter subunit D
MAFAHRHLKRLLAFSIIAHMGVMLTGTAPITPRALGKFVLYVSGHGLIKSSLFMIAGIVIALCNSADGIRLYRQGRSFWPTGVAMGIAGLPLGGLPVGMLHAATDALPPIGPLSGFLSCWRPV